MSETENADARIEQIVSAINEKDREALGSLFSEKALREADGFDDKIDYLYDFFQDNIDSWERNDLSSDESIRNGKKSLMIRFAFDLHTNNDVYRFFIIDYSKDTIDPENQGVYMLELIAFTDRTDLEAWQDRMRAGIYIH